MQRRYDQTEHPEASRDAWSEAWGDPALQDLGRQLVAYGVAPEQAVIVVEQTWLFCSYEALPLLGERLPMGIAAKAADRPKVWLSLPFQTSEDPVVPANAEPWFLRLSQVFTRKFETPLADVVAMDLEPVGMIFGPGFPDALTLRRFEDRVREVSARRNREFVGIFIDDLIAELMTVMDPEDVSLWLQTPNSAFGGRRPVELVDDRSDWQFRDVITRAKFNLSTA